MLDEASDAALTAFQDVLSDESLWWEDTLQRGQMQFINNFGIAHTRTAFQDADAPVLKRHLARYWIRDEGSIFFL
jgi:alpha-ketoglutarate-dependent taurine dioxygenase